MTPETEAKLRVQFAEIWREIDEARAIALANGFNTLDEYLKSRDLNRGSRPYENETQYSKDFTPSL